MKKYTIIFASICILVGGFTAYMARAFLHSPEQMVKIYTNQTNYDYQNLITQYEALLANARIIYKTLDIRTGDLTVTENLIPNFMVNRTKDELQNIFTNWEILNFTENDITIKRIIETLPEAEYTLSINEEFIVIFIGTKEDNNILEITTMTYDHLPSADIEILERGIPLANRDELIRRLEDFSS
ncbi:MAG: hypothetical protein FWF57_09045 [Defluviitaleaceae bacterium]|nr:hypothetical protein [Defluviitaleaceae bacterium]